MMAYEMYADASKIMPNRGTKKPTNSCIILPSPSLRSNFSPKCPELNMLVNTVCRGEMYRNTVKLKAALCDPHNKILSISQHQICY